MYKRISSRQNNIIKQIRQARLSKGKWARFALAEGFRLCEEVLRAGLEIEAVLIDERLNLEELSAYTMQAEETYILDTELFAYVADTVNPQGLMLVVRMPENVSLNDLAKHLQYENGLIAESSLLVLEQVQDPGNLGTILRTAYAMGYDAAILTANGAKPYQDKVLRAGMGASFHLPIYEVQDSREVLHWLKENQIVSLAMELNGTDLKNYKRSERIALWIGNEGNGLSNEVIQAAEEKLSIAMPGGAESLNAAVAAAIAIYEISR